MIKYACNAFHALKIGFANEIGTVAGSLGVIPWRPCGLMPGYQAATFRQAYLKPGFAVRRFLPSQGPAGAGLSRRAAGSRLTGLEVHPAEQSGAPGTRHPGRPRISGRIGIYGLAFKENTDDIRESPVVTLIEQLIGKGREIRIYDPHIRLANVYGSNLGFVTKALPTFRRVMVDSAGELLAWAEHICRPEAAGRFSEQLQAARSALAPTSPRWGRRPGTLWGGLCQ